MGRADLRHGTPTVQGFRPGDLAGTGASNEHVEHDRNLVARSQPGSYGDHVECETCTLADVTDRTSLLLVVSDRSGKRLV